MSDSKFGMNFMLSSNCTSKTKIPYLIFKVDGDHKPT